MHGVAVGALFHLQPEATGATVDAVDFRFAMDG